MRNIKQKLNDLYGKSEEQSEKKQDKLSVSQIRLSLDRLFTSNATKFFPKTKLEKENRPIEKLVQGSWINTAFGDVFRGEYTFNMNDLYGNLDLKEIYQFSVDEFIECFQFFGDFRPESFLFLDTETTGLAGGSGTVAFMIGLGWIDGNNFVVHQYFITQLNHEEGMLEEIGRIIEKFDFIVSFNGKSYDIPLLETRFIMNKLIPMFDTKKHIDLLHPSRALWKFSLTNCKLKTLESKLMGLERNDDIPGELIPEVYYEYIEAGVSDRMERVFYHNRFDIITMLGTLILVMKYMVKSEPEENPLNDYAKGRIFKKKKETDRSINHFLNVLNSEISDSRRQKTLIELGEIYKKEKKYKEAVKVWESAIDSDYKFTFSPYIELAKYYEHREKNFEKALNYTSTVLEKLPEYMMKELPSIEKRITRLKSKIQRS